MSKEESKAFRDSMAVSLSKPKPLIYSPDEIFKEIEKKQLQELAALVGESCNERLIIYKDPKVKELVNYVLAAI